MTEPKTARRTALVVIAVLLALLGIMATTWVGGKARDLEDRIEDLRAMRHEWVQLAGERLPVRGEGVPGNAWEDYREALNGIRDLKRIKVPSNDEPIPAPPPEVLALADGIRAGALRTSVRIQEPEDLENAVAYPSPTNVAFAAQWCVRFELQKGHPLRAVDRILDAVWFGSDLMRAGDYAANRRGLDILQRSLRCAAEILLADPAVAENRMLPALKRLHSSFPGIDGILMDLGIRNTDWVLKGDYSSRFRSSNPVLQWINDNLRKPVFLADVGGLLDDYERMRLPLDSPWPDLRQGWVAIRERPSLSSRLNIGEFWTHTLWTYSHQRRVLALLRLLMVGCGESELGRTDPFGDGSERIRFRRETERIVFWSVGQDGADDGGPAPDDAAGFVLSIDGKPSHDLTLVLPLHR